VSQVSKEGSNEALIINTVTHYDPALHHRPADFDAALEGLDDPNLLPVVNPAGRYAQWLKDGRGKASDVPFALDPTGTSFDLEYGIILGIEHPSGSRWATASNP
jgi:hypothetical protein